MVSRGIRELPQLGREMLGADVTRLLQYVLARFDNWPRENAAQYPEAIRMAVTAIARIITIACVAVTLPIVAPFALHVVVSSALREGEFNLLSAIDGFDTRLEAMRDALNIPHFRGDLDDRRRAAYLGLSTLQKGELVFGVCHDLFQEEPKAGENSALFYGYQVLKAMQLTATFLFLTVPVDSFHRALSFLTFAISAIGLALVAIAKTISSLVLSLPLYIADCIQRYNCTGSEDDVFSENGKLQFGQFRFLGESNNARVVPEASSHDDTDTYMIRRDYNTACMADIGV